MTNCAIVDFNPPPPDGKTEYKWVSLYGERNRVDHCYFSGKTHGGSTLVVWLDAPPNDKPNGHRIDHNHFGPRPVLGVNGGETIRVGDSARSLLSSKTLVERNYFEQCDGELEIISNKSCDNVYRMNTFEKCSGALCLRHSNRCLVNGNFFLGGNARGSGGVRVIGEEHVVVNNYFADLAGDDQRAALTLVDGVPNSPLDEYFQVKRAVIAFNTFVNNKQNLYFGAGKGSSQRTLPPTDCVIANNLVFGTKGPLIKVTDEPLDTVYRGNILFGADLGRKAQGLREVDPQLAQSPDGLFRPAPGSPVLNTAEQIELPFKNEDVAALLSRNKNIGADVPATDDAARLPVTAKDVGPSWR